MKIKPYILTLLFPIVLFSQQKLAAVLGALNNIEEIQTLPKKSVAITNLQQLEQTKDVMYVYQHPQRENVEIVLLQISSYNEFAIFALPSKEVLMVEPNIITHGFDAYLLVDFKRKRYFNFYMSYSYAFGRGEKNEFVVNIDLLTGIENIVEIDNFLKPKATIQTDFDINEDSFGGKMYQYTRYKQENQQWYQNIIDINNRNLFLEQVSYDQFLSLYNKIDSKSNWEICEDRYFTFYHISN